MNSKTIYVNILELMLTGDFKNTIEMMPKGSLIRNYLRYKAKAPIYYPIKFVSGFIYPKPKGYKGCWKSNSGKEIYHPIAYLRNGGRAIYHHSTCRVEVGTDWFLNHFIKLKDKH